MSAQRQMKAITLGDFDGNVWAANEAADKLGDIEGYTVIVDARWVIQTREPFVEQFVERVMTEGKAKDLVVVWPNGELVGFLKKALAARGMEDRLSYGPVAMLDAEGLISVA